MNPHNGSKKEENKKATEDMESVECPGKLHVRGDNHRECRWNIALGDAHRSNRSLLRSNTCFGLWHARSRGDKPGRYRKRARDGPWGHGEQFPKQYDSDGNPGCYRWGRVQDRPPTSQAPVVLHKQKFGKTDARSWHPNLR